ncbi:MAG: hypothetical protein WCI55_01455 [Armatimonadota bacterium]
MLNPNFALHSVSSYVYGTTRLGDESIPLTDRIAIAREAINAGVWIHTSDQYGEALKVLAVAIRETRVPPQFFKVGHDSVDQIRQSMISQLDTIGLGEMTVGQLCLGGNLATAFANGDDAAFELNELKTEGRVSSYVLEVFPWISEVPYQALQKGHASKLVDAYIFYLNPLQRFVTNELWDLIVERQFPVVAMRTVCGGDIRSLVHRDNYVGERAQQVLPLFARSGCASWTEFCVRFVKGFPFVVSTVGSTSRSENLNDFVNIRLEEVQPLPAEIHEELLALQRKWSDDVDRHAMPWTM